MAATTVITRAVKGSALTHNEMDSNWNNLNNVGVGVGHMLMWPTETPPDATWLPCDGRSVAAASYPDLFGVIGYSYGGAGANFNVPDMRGVFPRGWAQDSFLDPDTLSRGNRGDGTTGNHVGTRQLDDLKNHQNTKTYQYATGGELNLGFLYTDPNVYHAGGDSRTTDGNHIMTTDASGGGSNPDGSGGETRPKNVYVLFIIKALL